MAMPCWTGHTEGNVVNEFKTDGLATMAFPIRCFHMGKVVTSFSIHLHTVSPCTLATRTLPPKSKCDLQKASLDVESN